MKQQKPLCAQPENKKKHIIVNETSLNVLLS